MADTHKGGMTVSEAGRRGGNKVKERYGRGHYVSIGKKGGDSLLKERGREFFSDMGKKGGKSKAKKSGQRRAT